MNSLGTLLILVIIAAGIYFAYWAIKKTLKDDAGKNRRQRRVSKRK